MDKGVGGLFCLCFDTGEFWKSKHRLFGTLFRWEGKHWKVCVTSAAVREFQTIFFSIYIFIF